MDKSNVTTLIPKDKKERVSKELYLRKILGKGDWSYIPGGSKSRTYKNLNKQQLVVFRFSTLGYEALAKGLKCVSFYENFPVKDSIVKYPKSGIFWTNNKNYHNVEKILKKVIGLNNKKWKKIAKKYSTEILTYDPKNTKIKKILRNILKKKSR